MISISLNKNITNFVLLEKDYQSVLVGSIVEFVHCNKIDFNNGYYDGK